MERAATGLDERIARRVRELRAEQGLSLDALAARSGVSRAMISRIERAESSPTAALLEKVAAGLNFSLASLFDAPRAVPDPVSRVADQPVWRDPESGYLRRNVSPPGVRSPIQIVEVRFPAGAHVAYEAGPRQPPLHQQVWMLEGAMEITVGAARHRLRAGDCLAMRLDQPVRFRNRTRAAARYAVVLASEPASRRSP